MCDQCNIPTNAAEGYAERLLEIFNDSSLGLMISLGYRSGLLDAMGAMSEPATSEEIAEAAGLNERYVREWLGAMTVGRIIACDPDGPRYLLPDDRKAVMTRAAGRDNMAPFMQFVGLMGEVETRVLECFRNGGGVPYEAYGRFQEVMAEESGQTVVQSLIDDILPLAPGIHENLTEGIMVADLGCGRGMALNLLARRYPASRFIGYDRDPEAIAFAKTQARDQGTNNVTFEERDLTTFDTDGPEAAFDLILTFDAVHDQGRPDRMLAGIHRALKPMGTYLMQDISGSSNHYENIEHPTGPFIYTVSCMHCMTVSLANGGMGLGAAWGRQLALAMLEEAGFTDVAVHTLDHDIMNYYYVMQRQPEARALTA